MSLAARTRAVDRFVEECAAARWSLPLSVMEKLHDLAKRTELDDNDFISVLASERQKVIDRANFLKKLANRQFS